MPNQLILPIPEIADSPDSRETKRTPEHAWLAWAASQWASFHGSPMTVRWARDIALIRPLLRLHGEKELKSRWVAFVTTMDEYFARRGWDIPSFSRAIDRYVGLEDRVPQTRRRQLLQEEASCRDPLTGIDLRLNRSRR
jgi:hypothetical protein